MTDVTCATIDATKKLKTQLRQGSTWEDAKVVLHALCENTYPDAGENYREMYWRLSNIAKRHIGATA